MMFFVCMDDLEYSIFRLLNKNVKTRGDTPQRKSLKEKKISTIRSDKRLDCILYFVFYSFIPSTKKAKAIN